MNKLNPDTKLNLRELFRLASLIGTEPQDEMRHQKQLLEFINIYTHNLINKRIEARSKSLLDVIESELPEKKSIVVIPDIPTASYDFVNGFGHGEATGYNQAIDDIRSLLTNQRKEQ